MFIPPRTKRGADSSCSRVPRMLSAVTVGAVALGATLGLVPSAAADPAPDRGQPLVVDIVGDSYMAGEADPRHRSLVSPALQALSRVAAKNPGLKVDANIVASSGAVTADYFAEQREVDVQGEDVVVNPAQHHQIRPNAQVVIVGFGGNDAELAEVLAVAKPSNGSTPGDLDAKIKNYNGLLDIGGTDKVYLDQAAKAQLGKAPTLVSRMVQVLAGIANRAPNARIVVTNYPLAVDPENPHSVALIKKRDLVTVQKFLLDVNETIERAVQICACATLADLTSAHDGHEAYTDESAYAEPANGQPHAESVRPNDEGAALMADPLAKNLATVLGISPPDASGGKVTRPDNIDARLGESDVDGDLVPDFRDEAPNDPRDHRQRHDGPDRDRSDRSDRSDRDRSDRDRSDRDRSDRNRPSRQQQARVIPRLLPDVAGVLELGRQERDSRPDGNLPVQILPPLSPNQKREAEPDKLPEDRKAAEADAAERKPSGAGGFSWRVPQWPILDNDEVEERGRALEPAEPAEEERGFGRVFEPAETVPEAEETEAPVDETESQERLRWRYVQTGEETSEGTELREWAHWTIDRAGQDEESFHWFDQTIIVPRPGEPAEQIDETVDEAPPEDPAAQADEDPTDEVPAEQAPAPQPSDETQPEESAEVPVDEQAEPPVHGLPVVPAEPPVAEQAEPPVHGLPVVPAEPPVAEQAEPPDHGLPVVPAEEVVEQQPVEQVDEAPAPPPAEEPVEVVPDEPVDEATDGQQVCVLIYPSPESCGTEWNK
jgi:lysophospholipase L1-like esterase